MTQQLTIFQMMPSKANDNNTIEEKYINGELHVRVGFDWFRKSECPNPTYTPIDEKELKRMDLTKQNLPTNPSRTGYKEQTLPKTRNSSTY